MAKYSGDLPLNADPSARFMPWIIALMVYLASLSLIVACAVSATVDKWDQGFRARLSVEIPAPNLMDSQHTVRMASARSRINQVLMRTPGIGRVHNLSNKEIASVLEPWIGDESTVTHLPMPGLIDVEVADRSLLDIDMLRKNLQAILPGVVVEDHMGWQKGVLDLAYSAQVIGYLVVALIMLAAVGTIGFTSQTSLIMHRHIIEVLYLIGASADYIARQFQHHALRIGLWGGLAGFILSALTLFVIQFFIQNIHMTVLHNLLNQGIIWFTIFCVPITVTCFVMLSARLTVHLALRYWHKNGER